MIPPNDKAQPEPVMRPAGLQFTTELGAHYWLGLVPLLGEVRADDRTTPIPRGR
jgi:hypothetical protein